MSAVALRSRLQRLTGAKAEVTVAPGNRDSFRAQHFVSVRIWLPGHRRYAELRGSIEDSALCDVRQQTYFAEEFARRAHEAAEDMANHALNLPRHVVRRQREAGVRRARLRADREAMMRGAW